MKKQMFGSVLALTAGMANQVVFPSFSEARSTMVESRFAKQFLLKLQATARIKNNDGSYSQGSIFLELNQSPFTPVFNNQLNGEMHGTMYFESDEQKPVYWALIGDDGEALVDQIHSSKDQNIYQIYGCNSTLTSCQAEKFQLTIEAANVYMDLEIGQNSLVEILDTVYVTDKDGKTVEQEQWVKSSFNVPMIEVPLKK